MNDWTCNKGQHNEYNEYNEYNDNDSNKANNTPAGADNSSLVAVDHQPLTLAC